MIAAVHCAANGVCPELHTGPQNLIRFAIALTIILAVVALVALAAGAREEARDNHH